MLTASALINEIYFDPPASGDIAYEYIELRGTPGMSLDNHYLIFLENENDMLNTGNPGMVERIFNLSGQSIGSDGFLTLRQKGSPYKSPRHDRPGELGQRIGLGSRTHELTQRRRRKRRSDDRKQRIHRHAHRQ